MGGGTGTGGNKFDSRAYVEAAEERAARHRAKIESAISGILQAATEVIDELLANGSVTNSDELWSKGLPDGMPAAARRHDDSGHEITHTLSPGELLSVNHAEFTKYEIADAGFYAGVLAVKTGLVNPDDFEFERKVRDNG